nr:MAG TPA: hypothetical protein [Caudoviricetes sp.]
MIPPGLRSAPGSFYTLPLLDRYPAPEKSPGVCRKGAGSIQPAQICAGFSFTARP